ncbi:hypothetical protein NPIL_244321 [Nephila pilipes]|uniref:Uncharacterized protein n=1 Tax=Nephila pilipes TaxID=299642 RepID=A0A8X6TCC6_NEPPI|nr:hypothetical protein NPIL_244321 [Nephila pilipes]
MPFFNHHILENPPPPNEDFDYINFPVVEHFLWPQRIRGPQRIHVNYNLIHRSFFVDEESDEESTNAADSNGKNQVHQTNNVQEVSNISQKTNAQGVSTIPQETNAQEASNIPLGSNFKVESNIQLETNAERESNDEKQIDVPIKDPEIKKSGKKMQKKKHKERRHHKRHHKRDSSSDKERHSRRSKASWSSLG